MSSQEIESFFGTIFSPSSESASSYEGSSSATSLSISNSSESSLFHTLLKWLQKKGLYLFGAIIILMLIIWLYSRYQNRQLPRQFEHFGGHKDDQEILTEEMIVDSERSEPSLPLLPEPIQSLPLNPLIKMEQDLTQLYSEFEKSASGPEKDIQKLHTSVSAMASILAKIREHIIPVLQSEQSPAELKEQLQKGLQDAELIVTMAQNKVEELKRIQTASENEQETKSVVKNMHYLGLGNKIKKAKGYLPSV
jgi:hypothetical protein